jgi:ribulose-bisphosphate carboxylase large chain
MKFNIFREEVDSYNYVIATFYLKSKVSLRDASWNLAIGQSVGNPKVRNSWETDELFENHSCVIFENEKKIEKVKSGIVKIGFPVSNTDWEGDGVSHLLCQLVGGQADIDTIVKCRLLNVEIPNHILSQYFYKPKFGISGFREITGSSNRPFVGSIIKPKTGVAPEVILEMTKQLVDGGADFIKEDEILSNPAFCKLEKRVELISSWLDKNAPHVVYTYCINADHTHVLNRVRKVHQLGGKGIHVNVWSGLGVYKAVRSLDLPIFIHFQKSGDKFFTGKNHDFGIDWDVICYLATISGVDSIHAGMWGGYLSDDTNSLRKTLEILQKGNVIASLSCGMHPGLVQSVTKEFGTDYMASAGGAIHGHPDGTKAGARAMKQAACGERGEEFEKAVSLWGEGFK